MSGANMLVALLLALLLLVPLNAWNVAITTDIPLMLFAALTVALYLRARETGTREALG